MEKTLIDTLQGVPCNFSTFDFVKSIGNDKREKILRKIESERDISGFDHDVEEIRALNFISYLYFTINDYKSAFQYNEEVLGKKPDNINALACRAWYHLKKSEFGDCKEYCDKLKFVRENTQQVVIAKAEVAFVCSSLGVMMYTEAETLFRSVLKACQYDNVEVTDYCICLWKFGLALILRRQLNTHSIHKVNMRYMDADSSALCRIEVLELFNSIIRMDGGHLNRVRARSLVQVGEIFRGLSFQSDTDIKNNELYNSFQGRTMKEKARECFNIALRLQPEDVFVLEKSTKYFRYVDIDLSISLCERSLNIRPTSIAHHYMALALKRQLEPWLKKKLTPYDSSHRQNKQHHVRNLSSDMEACQQQMSVQRLDSGIGSMESSKSMDEQDHDFSSDTNVTSNQSPLSIGDKSNTVEQQVGITPCDTSHLQTSYEMENQGADYHPSSHKRIPENTQHQIGAGPTSKYKANTKLSLDTNLGQSGETVPQVKTSISSGEYGQVKPPTTQSKYMPKCEKQASANCIEADIMRYDSGTYSMEDTMENQTGSETPSTFKAQQQVSSNLDCMEDINSNLQNIALSKEQGNTIDKRPVIVNKSNNDRKTGSPSAVQTSNRLETMKHDDNDAYQRSNRDRGKRDRGQTQFKRGGYGYGSGAMVDPYSSYFTRQLHYTYPYPTGYYPQQMHHNREQYFQNSNRRGGNVGSRRHDANTRGKNYRHNRHFSLSKERSLSNMIKSPKKVDPLSPDQVADILHHLDKSVELDKNMAAVYDKGLVMRRIGREQEAIEIFKSMFQDQGCSMVLLADAYEQSALCLLEKIKKDDKMDLTLKAKYEMDIGEYLKKSIEVACYLVAKLPDLKQRWTSFPTLKNILMGKERSKGNVKELGKLHTLVQDYSGAINWYEEVLKMECDDQDKAHVCMDIVNVSLQAKKYDEAILYLDMIMCFEKSCRELIDKGLYLEAHIQGGLEAWSTNQKDLASLRIKNALDYNRGELKPDSVNSEQAQDDCSPKWFDVFVLCDPSSEEIGQKVVEYLSSLGLDVTINDEYADANTTCLTGTAEVIEISSHSVIVLGESMSQVKRMKFMTDMILNTHDERGGFGNVVVLEEHWKVKKERMFRRFPSMSCTDIDKNGEAFKPWLKNLLLMIASGKNVDSVQNTD